MSVIAHQVSVTVEATLLNVTPDLDPQVMNRTGVMQVSYAVVRNAGAASVFLGGPAVTATDGFELAAAATEHFTLSAEDELYGIAAAGTVECHVLQSGV